MFLLLWILEQLFSILKVYSADEYKMSGEKLSLIAKLCFGIGGLPYQMKANALALFIAPFLLEVAKVIGFFLCYSF